MTNPHSVNKLTNFVLINFPQSLSHKKCFSVQFYLCQVAQGYLELILIQTKYKAFSSIKGGPLILWLGAICEIIFIKQVKVPNLGDFINYNIFTLKSSRYFQIPYLN